jgi:hypothetical protein
MDPHPTSRTLDTHINHLAAVEQLGEVTVTLDISILLTDVGSLTLARPNSSTCLLLRFWEMMCIANNLDARLGTRTDKTDSSLRKACPLPSRTQRTSRGSTFTVNDQGS